MIDFSDEYIRNFFNVYIKAQMDGYTSGDAMRLALTWHETEFAVVWDTTCGGCRRLLDRLYERDVEDGNI